MFLENFNPEDQNDMERLFEYLDKDKFNSLSFDEQNEMLDFLLDCTEGKTVGSKKVTTIGIMDGFSGDNFNIKTAINRLGRDKVKELLREAISSNAMHMNKVTLGDLKDAIERLKEGKATKEDMIILDSILKAKTGHHIFSSEKNQMDVDFSTFAILKAYCAYFDFEDPDGENTFVKDIEPLINAVYCVAMAGIISNQDNPVGAMFDKHGYDKVQKDVIDLTVKLSDIIVDYSKDNLIAPEKIFLALLNVLKIISGTLDINLDNYDENKVEDLLYHIMFAEREKNHEEIDSFVKECIIDEDSEHDNEDDEKPINNNIIKNESDKPLANANKMDSKTKVDIRKLLLDD